MASLEAIVENTMDCFGGDSVVFVAHKTPKRGNPARTVYSLGVFVSLLSIFLICIPLISCTKPEHGINPDELLATLLDIPPIPFPLETEANKLNEGYLLTVDNLSEVINDRYFSYHFWIEPIYSEGITAEKHEDYYRWRRPLNNLNNQVIILMVTTGDTLAFQINFEGSGWGPPGSFWYKGWVFPEDKKTYMWGGNGIEASWKSLPLGHRLYFSWPDPFWQGPSTVAFDSTNGGGYLEMKIGLDLRYEAHWDDYGHGTWWSFTQGSGGW